MPMSYTKQRRFALERSQVRELFSMTDRSAARYVPQSPTLERLRAAAGACEGCDLYKDATQTVFGEGRVNVPIMFVGEAPGDSEDREGRPFIGPAGKLLRRAMTRAGIVESDVYVTNAVKHFKFIWRGKRRIHASPKRIEVRACFPWLESEIAAVAPELVVALGATAAQALLGANFRVTEHRGELLSSPVARRVIATIHPSAILRTMDEAERQSEFERFAGDLERAAQAVASGGRSKGSEV